MSRRRPRKRNTSPEPAAKTRLGQLFNPYEPIAALDETALDQIHDASMRILEDIGLEILNEKALGLYQQDGARVDWDKQRVYLDREAVMARIATVPAEFTMHAPNPERNRVVGGNAINFTTVASAPNSSDLEGGRRTGNFNDYCNFLRLTHSFDVIDFISGYPVEPIDLAPDTRHLDATLAAYTLTDRAFSLYCLGGGRVIDGIRMTAIARGVDLQTLKSEPSINSVVNTNSPLRVDGPMLDGLIEMAEYGQPVIVTPFTLSGAMCPITIAGALAQQNAEALGVIALSQIVNPGAPMVYGGFTSNADMRSGSPAFGTPEYTRAAWASGQLARRYSLPFRSSNTNAANCVDAQAAWESQMSLWGAIMGHANIIKHAAGWLEGGLCASFEKFIIDIDMLQMMRETLTPLQVDESTLALDAIVEAGHGGHFFGTAHTRERYRSAFYEPMVSDWSNFETWCENGSLNAFQRANAIYRQTLADYQPPEIEPQVRQSLEEYANERRRELELAR
ncbi:MAG: trimethylamine methyltransferase family protein [Gammaproteobacteria bacterium]|nr:MAG: trimethylamine methyltransferase family protein [Gammaproteobacteria bacterium]